MQTIIDLVNKIGVPVGIAFMSVVVAWLFKYYEALRKEADKDRKENERLNRESMERMFKAIQDHQERRDAEFVSSLRDIAQEMKENRRGGRAK